MDEFYEISHKYIKMGNDMILIHRDGFIMWANQRFLQTLGFNLLEVTGRHCIEFVSWEYREAVLERIARGFEHADQVNDPIDVKYITSEGSTFWISTVSSPIKLESGPAVLVIGKDVTERKADEELIKDVLIRLLPKQQGKLFDLLVKGIPREKIIKIMDLDNDTINRYIRRIRERIKLTENDYLFNRLLQFFRNK